MTQDIERYAARAEELSEGGEYEWWTGLAAILRSQATLTAERDALASLLREEQDAHSRTSFAAWQDKEASQALVQSMREALEPFVEILNVSEANAIKDGRDPAKVPDSFDVLAFRDVPGLKLAAFRKARSALAQVKP